MTREPINRPFLMAELVALLAVNGYTARAEDDGVLVEGWTPDEPGQRKPTWIRIRVRVTTHPIPRWDYEYEHPDGTSTPPMRELVAGDVGEAVGTIPLFMLPAENSADMSASDLIQRFIDDNRRG